MGSGMGFMNYYLVLGAPASLEVRRLESLYGVWYGVHKLLDCYGCAGKSEVRRLESLYEV